MAVKILLLATVLILKWQSSGFDIPFSPCPEIFNYQSENGIWTGQLKVNIEEEQLPIVVQVHLVLKVVLKTAPECKHYSEQRKCRMFKFPTGPKTKKHLAEVFEKYVGLIELTEPPEILLEKLLYNKIDTVDYIIRFPLPFPIPQLKKIIINHSVVCKGKEVIGEVITNILLEHSFPTNPALLKLLPAPNIHRQVEDEICGKTHQGNKFEVRKVLGWGEWPWLAAILIKKDSKIQLHCTGNLITKNHVITAAHCVNNPRDGEIPANKFVIYLGKYNLNRLGETGSQIKQLARASLHPEYSTEFYRADIAVLHLISPVQFNVYVRPVCLWTGELSTDLLYSRLGMTVIWGRRGSKNPYSSEPTMFELPIVDQEKCIKSNVNFVYLTSNRTLCAGSRNGDGPCNGDSGSGLMILTLNRNNEMVWMLRGIASLSLLSEDYSSCDLSNYVVFTDVAKFTNWVLTVINA